MFNIFNKKKSEITLPEIPAALKDSITVNYLETVKGFAEKGEGPEKAGLEAITTLIFLREMKDTTEYLNKRYGNMGINSPDGQEAINAYLFHRMMETQDGKNAFIRVNKYLADLVAGNEKRGTHE